MPGFLRCQCVCSFAGIRGSCWSGVALRGQKPYQVLLQLLRNVNIPVGCQVPDGLQQVREPAVILLAGHRLPGCCCRGGDPVAPEACPASAALFRKQHSKRAVTAESRV